MRSVLRAAAVGAAGVAALSLDLQSPASIKSAAQTAAKGMMNYYHGNTPGNTPGLLPMPYYWWEAGAMMGALIDYWYSTGDDTYNADVSQALLFQASPTLNFMPANQTKSEGNDDQVFWAFAAMTAAEAKFPNPPRDQPQWATLAEAVFNSQAARWDTQTCGGGLRWQIFQFNNGYNYKNTPSNAGFMDLGARLYAYTGNASYAPWVEQSWAWMARVGTIAPDYTVFDGTSTPDNCTSLEHDQWTYNAGMVLHTAAIMWNLTQTAEWETRLRGVWNATAAATAFWDGGKVMREICEPTKACNTDQPSFKSYLTRSMAASTKYAPFLLPLMTPYFTASAAAAAQQCSGGSDGVTCGTQWTAGGAWDGTYGVGQQMSALQIFQANLIASLPAPATAAAEGASQGNASFGTGGDTGDRVVFQEITAADRAGAGILTAVVIACTLAGSWWLVS